MHSEVAPATVPPPVKLGGGPEDLLPEVKSNPQLP